MNPQNLTSTLLLALCASHALLAAESPVKPRIEGRWEGVVVIRPAEYEMDLLLDVLPATDQGWKGSLSYPTQGVKDQPLEGVAVDQSKVTFSVRDENNVVSSYVGWLSDDGKEIAGDLTESGQHYLFRLRKAERTASPAVSPPAAAPRRLGDDGQALRQAFNEDEGKVRLLMILSPSCLMCKNGARLVQRYILDEIDGKDLRVYVVWEAIQPGDNEAVAREAGALIADPRVTQFWADHRFAGRAFQEALGLKSSPAWDVFLLFPRASRWQDAVARPHSFMHNLVLATEDLPRDRRLNAKTLAEEIRALLAAR